MSIDVTPAWLKTPFDHPVTIQCFKTDNVICQLSLSTCRGYYATVVFECQTQCEGGSEACLHFGSIPN